LRVDGALFKIGVCMFLCMILKGHLTCFSRLFYVFFEFYVCMFVYAGLFDVCIYVFIGFSYVCMYMFIGLFYVRKYIYIGLFSVCRIFEAENRRQRELQRKVMTE